MISRFRAELLDADIDLQTCDAALKGPGAFFVASRVTGGRMAVAVVFGIPALYLAFRGLGSEGKLIGLLAIVFCPILAGVAILLGFVIAEKSFDRPNDRAKKSIGESRKLTMPPTLAADPRTKREFGTRYLPIGFCGSVAPGLAGFTSVMITSPDTRTSCPVAPSVKA